MRISLSSRLTAASLLILLACAIAVGQEAKPKVVSEKGKGWYVKQTLIRFNGANDLQKLAQQTLDQEAATASKQFRKDSKALLKNTKDHFGDLYLTSTFTTTCSSPSLISGFTETEEYLFGAHNASRVKTWSFGLVNGHPAVLQRLDIFLKNADLDAIGKKSIIPRIQTRIPSDTIIDDLKNADMNSFTVSPRGIEWVFGVYQVAPFSAGTVAILVPWHEVSGAINWMGAMRGLKSAPNFQGR